MLLTENMPLMPTTVSSATELCTGKLQSDAMDGVEEQHANVQQEKVQEQQNDVEMHDAQDLQPQQEHENPEAEEPKEEQKGRKAPRRNLRARVLADLGDASPAEAMAKISAKLLAHDELVAAAKAQEAASAVAVEEVLMEAKAAAAEIQAAEDQEAACLAKMKAIEARRKEAAKLTARNRISLQQRQDMFVLIEMEASRAPVHDTAESFESLQEHKKQRIEELERVMADSRRQVDELKQKEREAKAAMKQLLKEQQQLTCLGPFGRRTRAAFAKQSAAITASTSSSSGADASTAADAAAAAAAPIADQAAPLLMPVKRELGALQAFSSRPLFSAEPVVILLEDSQ